MGKRYGRSERSPDERNGLDLMRFRSAVGVRGRKCCARGTLRGDRGDDRTIVSASERSSKANPKIVQFPGFAWGPFFRQKSFKCTKLSELFSV